MLQQMVITIDYKTLDQDSYFIIVKYFFYNLFILPIGHLDFILNMKIIFLEHCIFDEVFDIQRHCLNS